jgi:hypothetical protein
MSSYLPTIPEEVRVATCLPGAGHLTCRFLTFAPGGWGCAKRSDLAAYIGKRIAEGTMRAQGDNCSGAPEFTPTPPQAVPTKTEDATNAL